jgi:hypothetical protein
VVISTVVLAALASYCVAVVKLSSERRRDDATMRATEAK